MRLVLAACGLTICVVTWAFQGDQTGRIASHLLLYGIAFACYLVVLDAAQGLSARGLRICLALAALWRVLLAFSPPLLSDDIYRYVWEGRVQLHGGNPYLEADRPDSPRLAPLRDTTWERVNHKEYSAIYPPFFELFARLVVWVSDSVTAMKLSFVLAEGAALLLLLLILREKGLPRERILVQAFSPLALVEIAGSGHNDALGMPFVALALLGLSRGAPALSATALGFGASTKVLPGLYALAWARRFRPLHAASMLLPVLLCVLPFRSAGGGLVRTLFSYARAWRFNETLFPLLRAFGPPALVSTALLVLLALALGLFRVAPEKAALALTASALLLAPTVLPWYALWTLPLLVLVDAPEVLLFTFTVHLAYLVYPAWQSGEPWRIDWGLRSLEYGPVLAVALWRGIGDRLGSPWTRSSSS